MNITTIRFTAKVSPHGACNGCLCFSQVSTTCRAMNATAVANGLPDCDDAPGYIYVLDESDPRQMSLLEE